MRVHRLAPAAALCASLAVARAQNDPGGGFGPKTALPLAGRASGAVSGDGTTIYVASQAGELYLADVKSGGGRLLNRGGDDRSLGDLCIDSREGKTLYGAGRESGKLFAFDAQGVLETEFRVTDTSGDTGQHYVSSCVQSRYELWVSDAFDDVIYKWPLADKGPERGRPPLKVKGGRDGEPVKLGGSWEGASEGQMGAISLEWSAAWNETGWVLNSETGIIYTFPIDSEDVADCEIVAVDGQQTVFPGATKIMFDESNEHVLYVAQPSRNAIAVIEINDINPNQAMYIRTITSPLLKAPVALAQFGDFVYALNADLGAQNRTEADYSLSQLPRHRQILPENVDPAFKFSEVPDKPDPPQEIVFGEEQIMGYVIAKPSKTREVGKVVPLPSPLPKEETTRQPVEELDPVKVAEKEAEEAAERNRTAPETSGVSWGRQKNVEDDDEDDDGGSACWPASALVTLPGGEQRRMDELEIGDVVAVSPGLFSTVYLFTHRDAEAESTFVRIHHERDGGLPLEATPGHYVYLNGAMTAAGVVREGDRVMTAAGDVSGVTRVERIPRLAGLFNPQTMEGRIVVNNVVSSTYTTAVDPRAAEILLAPIRIAAFALGDSWSALAGKANVFQRGSSLVRFAPGGPTLLT